MLPDWATESQNHQLEFWNTFLAAGVGQATA